MENKIDEPIKVVDYEVAKEFFDKIMFHFNSFMTNYREYEKLFIEYESQVKKIEDMYRRKTFINLSDKEIQEKIAKHLFYAWVNWVKLILSTTTEDDDGSVIIPSIYANELKKLIGNHWEDVPIGNKVVFIDGAHEITRRL